MNATQYLQDAQRTLSDQYHNQRIHPNLMHASIGMVTEAGEFLDALKKVLFYGKPLDKVNLIEELGDMMWYVAVACVELGVSLEDVMQINIDKLKARFPERFTTVAANNRNLDKERDVLEKGAA